MVNENIIADILSLKIAHRYCEDSYYSCPLAEDGCSDENIPKGFCDCGADEHNLKVNSIVERLKES